MEQEFTFTGLEPIIDWLIETGLMDIFTDFVSEFSLELILALVTLVVGLLGNAMTWLVGAVGAAAAAIIAAVVAIVTAVVTFLSMLFFYLIHAIGLMRIAKKLGVKHRWMAWIPFANVYLLGACAEKSQTRNGKKPWKWGLILLFVTLGLTVGQPIVQFVISIVLSVLPMLSFVINAILECSSLILMAMTGYCLYLIFKEFLGKTGAIVMAVCAAVTGWFEGIFLFIVAFFKLRPAQESAKKEDDIVAVVEAE